MNYDSESQFLLCFSLPVVWDGGTTAQVCAEQMSCCCLNGQEVWLASIKTSPPSMCMGRERKKKNGYSAWWKSILLISLFMQSNILLVEAVKLSVKCSSLRIVTEPAFDLVFHTGIPVIWYSNQDILYFAKTAAQTRKTFLLKLFLHAQELNVLDIVSYCLTCHVNFVSEQYITFLVIKLNMRINTFIHLLNHSPYLHKRIPFS